MSTNTETNYKPVSQILSEISLAATAIVDLGSLIARLFADVSSQLPYDIRTSLGVIPPPAGANDQLFSIARVALPYKLRASLRNCDAP